MQYTHNSNVAVVLLLLCKFQQMCKR